MERLAIPTGRPLVPVVVASTKFSFVGIVLLIKDPLILKRSIVEISEVRILPDPLLDLKIKTLEEAGCTNTFLAYDIRSKSRQLIELTTVLDHGHKTLAKM